MIFCSAFIASVLFVFVVSAGMIGASGQTPAQQNLLEVKFANNVAESYSVMANSNEKLTVTQSHSWIRDESSRYNLVSYSLDSGNPVEIPRKARGSFSLDIPMDSGHTITFFAAIQYPISVSIDGNSADSAVQFNPPSSTGDNWFDTNASVKVTVPYHIVQQEQQSRKQLVGWAIDTSNFKEVSTEDLGSPEKFSTAPIIVGGKHSVEFFTKDQYYLQVISEQGTVAGGGWHDSGKEVAISVKPSSGFPINYVFDGSDGIQWTEADGYSTTILMDSSKTLVVKWKPDYTQFIIVGMAIPMILGAVIVIKRKKGRNRLLPKQTPLAVVDAPMARTGPARASASTLLQPQQNEQWQSSRLSSASPDQRTIGDEYARDIMHFAMIKSLETLESLYSAGLVPDSRIAITRQKLEQSFG